MTREDLVADLFGGYPAGDHIALLAQCVINNTGNLPDHITTSPFWNAYRDRFLGVLRDARVQKQHTQTTGVGARLLKASDALALELQEIRLRLSTDFDVPYVEPSAVPSSRGLFG